MRSSNYPLQPQLWVAGGNSIDCNEITLDLDRPKSQSYCFGQLSGTLATKHLFFSCWGAVFICLWRDFETLSLIFQLINLCWVSSSQCKTGTILSHDWKKVPAFTARWDMEAPKTSKRGTSTALYSYNSYTTFSECFLTSFVFISTQRLNIWLQKVVRNWSQTSNVQGVLPLRRESGLYIIFPLSPSVNFYSTKML